MNTEVPVRTEYDVPMLVNTLRWRKYTFPSGLKIVAGRITSKEDGFYDITFPFPFTVPPTAYLTTDYSATVTAKDVPPILWYGSKNFTTTSIRVYANSSLIQGGTTVYGSILLIGY